MENDIYLLLGVFGAIALYHWFALRVSALCQPLRFELAEVGEELLADDRVSPTDKRTIEIILSRSFSARMAWMLAGMFLLTFLPASRSEKTAEQSLHRLPDEVRRKLGRVFVLGSVVTLSNSPLAAAIFAFEVVFSALVLAPTGWLLRRAMNHAALSRGDHAPDLPSVPC